MSAAAVNEIREGVLRFLYERSALPHCLSAVIAGLRRSGTDASQAQAREALEYLEGMKWAEVRASPFGGGQGASVWKITSEGKIMHENLS